MCSSDLVEQIDALKKYGLFHSYEGLFDPANENNKEVLFDIQYIEGENSQGSYIDQYCGTGTGSWTRGSRYVPTDDLVAAYETIDGSPVDPENPYENRDPRLGFTAVLPGSYFLGYRFPNYLYPGGAFNHAGEMPTMPARTRLSLPSSRWRGLWAVPARSVSRNWVPRLLPTRKPFQT